MKLLTRLIACVFLLSITSLTVFAQGGAEPADITTSPVEWYTSIGGVSMATIFLVSVVKRLLGTVDGAASIPTWVYAVVISCGLTVLCVKVLGTLPGELWQLVWQAVYNAAIATGIYEWANNADTTLRQSAVKAQSASKV